MTDSVPQVGYLQGEYHQYWVCQEARMAVQNDEDFNTKCDRIQVFLQRATGIESCSTFSTPKSWQGDYAEVSLSGVISATSTLGALMNALPIFFAALKAGDLAGPDQWHDCKINRLSKLS